MLTPTLIVIYLLSVYFAFKYVQKSHYHLEGDYYPLPADLLDVIMILAPVMNTLVTLGYFGGYWRLYRHRRKRESLINKINTLIDNLFKNKFA